MIIKKWQNWKVAEFYWKVSELESGRIAQNRKLSEYTKIGKCLNQKVLEIARIGKYLNRDPAIQLNQLKSNLICPDKLDLMGLGQLFSAWAGCNFEVKYFNFCPLKLGRRAYIYTVQGVYFGN